MEEYVVIFKGFKTKEQAESFAFWYEGSGEQSFNYWSLEQKPPFAVYCDVNKDFYKQLEDGNVEVYLKVELEAED